MKFGKWSVVAAALTFTLLAGTTIASADGWPYTRGDAEAFFNATDNGGATVRLHAGVIEGAPADNGSRIGPGQRFQGFHVCATDWHVIDTHLFITDATDNVHNLAQARSLFDTISVTYELDGAPLAIHDTPVRPFLGDPTTFDPNANVAFARASGAILSPESLIVGAHTERVRLYVGGVLFDDFGDVTFIVDAVGTGACL